jgi:hypothetical protein
MMEKIEETVKKSSSPVVTEEQISQLIERGFISPGYASTQEAFDEASGKMYDIRAALIAPDQKVYFITNKFSEALEAAFKYHKGDTEPGGYCSEQMDYYREFIKHKIKVQQIEDAKAYLSNELEELIYENENAQHWEHTVDHFLRYDSRYNCLPSILEDDNRERWIGNFFKNPWPILTEVMNEKWYGDDWFEGITCYYDHVDETNVIKEIFCNIITLKKIEVLNKHLNALKNGRMYEGEINTGFKSLAEVISKQIENNNGYAKPTNRQLMFAYHFRHMVNPDLYPATKGCDWTKELGGRAGMDYATTMKRGKVPYQKPTPDELKVVIQLLGDDKQAQKIAINMLGE